VDFFWWLRDIAAAGCGPVNRHLLIIDLNLGFGGSVRIDKSKRLLFANRTERRISLRACSICGSYTQSSSANTTPDIPITSIFKAGQGLCACEVADRIYGRK